VAISASYLAFFNLIQNGFPFPTRLNKVSHIFEFITSYMIELEYYRIAFSAIYAGVVL